MVNQSDPQLQEKLDGIRERQHKFICLNDNIDHTHPKAKEAVQIMNDFYKSLVPIRSSFELPPGERNPHGWRDQILEMYIFYPFFFLPFFTSLTPYPLYSKQQERQQQLATLGFYFVVICSLFCLLRVLSKRFF